MPPMREPAIERPLVISENGAMLPRSARQRPISLCWDVVRHAKWPRTSGLDREANLTYRSYISPIIRNYEHMRISEMARQAAMRARFLSGRSRRRAWRAARLTSRQRQELRRYTCASISRTARPQMPQTTTPHGLSQRILSRAGLSCVTELFALTMTVSCYPTVERSTPAGRAHDSKDLDRSPQTAWSRTGCGACRSRVHVRLPAPGFWKIAAGMIPPGNDGDGRLAGDGRLGGWSAFLSCKYDPMSVFCERSWDIDVSSFAGERSHESRPT
jgi:hypothetical protein